MSTNETQDLRRLTWVHVGWLVGGSAWTQSVWVCRDRGSGATDAAESLITVRLRLGGIVTRVGLETQERQTWQKATIWHYLLSSCLSPLRQRRSTVQTAGQTWCFTWFSAAAAPVCLQEHVRRVCVCVFVTSLLNCCSCVWTPCSSPCLMHWIIPYKSTSILPAHTQTHTQTWITFQVVSQHNSYSLLIT